MNTTWHVYNDCIISLNAINGSSIFSITYKGMNRQRQKEHGSEIPEKRNPDLIITGAKKCGTTALKIFMNYHNSFQDTPGERHFFNRPSNWQKGYEW